MALEHDTQVLAKQILEDLKPELIIPSPYSIWDPSRMKFEVAGVTNPQSLAEMQALLVKKAFTVSDMYILRVTCGSVINLYGADGRTGKGRTKS